MITLEHQVPDRVPLDTWMSGGAIEVLCRHFNLPIETDPNGMWHDGILQRLRIDIRRPLPLYVGPPLKKYPDGSWETEVGVLRKGRGYGIAITHPLREATQIEQILDYTYPIPEWYDFSGLPDYCERNAQYTFTGGSKFPIFHEACDLMGMDRVMIKMIDDPELIHTVLQKLTDAHMAITTRWLEASPNSIDIMIITDDFGSKQNTLISLKHWREFFKPHLKRVVDFGHSCGCKVMLHSDGAIRNIIPDLIEMGIDILNPIEPEANNMDPAGIKRDFGDQLILHGAASSLNLAYATPEEIKAEVKGLMEQVAQGGGYILCPSNHIMEDMPVENILALYDTAYELGWY